VCEPTAGLVQSQALKLGPWAFASLPIMTMAQTRRCRNQKTKITLIFP
jgi:hypothetical protein